MWKDPFSVNVSQDLQEMAKPVMVGQEIKLLLIYFHLSISKSKSKYGLVGNIRKGHHANS